MRIADIELEVIEIRDLKGADKARYVEAAINDALTKHVKPAESIFPGLAALSIDREVQMRVHRRGLKKNGTIYLDLEEMKTNNLMKQFPYYAKLREADRVKLKEIEYEEVEGEDGEKTLLAKEQPPITFELRRLTNDEGTPISLGEVLIWAHLNDIEDEEGEERAREEFNVFYREDRPALPKQDTIRPTTHVQGISKVSDKIVEVDNGGSLYLDMSGDNEAKESVLTSLSLSYEGEDVQISKPMTPFDREVHDAVATLWAAGNRTITPRQVHQTMTGVSGKPSSATVKEVEKSLDKQRKTFVTLDYSDELRGKTAEFDGEIVTADQCRYEAYMLNADKVMLTTSNGADKIGYIIKAAPVLYRHDRTTKQITSYPQRLLEDTSKVVSMTPRNVLIRSYLIRRIKRMSHKGSKSSRNIRYDAICEAADMSCANRTEQKRVKDTAKKLLDAFVANGFIGGWTEYADKGSSHKLLGVTITPAKNS